MKSVFFILITLLTGLNLQEDEVLKKTRSSFQEIKSEEDIYLLSQVDVESAKYDARDIIKAYQAAATCMKAQYVFSPVSKQKFFNRGKQELEALIEKNKSVEKVYLRLLLQFNVPRILNYYKDIDGDILFLETHLAEAPIDLPYKKLMIKNLVSVADKNEIIDILLQIKVENC